MIISKLREKREDHWASGTDSKKGRARYTNVPVNLWETLRASYEARAQAWNQYGASVSAGNRDLDCSVVEDKSAPEQVFKAGRNIGASKALNLLGNKEVTSLLTNTRLGFGVKTTFWHLDLGFYLTYTKRANQLIEGYPPYT